MTSNAIDTVTFDLWNTLIAYDEFYDGRIREARISGIREALQRSGIGASRDALVAAYDGSERLLTERWSSSLDLDTPEQVGILLQCLGVTPEPGLISAVAEPYANAVLQVEPFLVDGAAEALEEIRARGMRVALISNTGRTPGRAMRVVMRRLGILDLFDVVTFSNEVGYLKPHPRIFEVTLSLLQAVPQRSVHVGDHDVLDVRGAKAFGMKSVRVMQYAQGQRNSCDPDASIETLAELLDAISCLKG